ncbi:MAG: hypothetical protein OEQ25_08085, partial [Gammaproteobacteria bacterium]|nr:hypothetical protein [Gammaproteobacteria bacterium]
GYQFEAHDVASVLRKLVHDYGKRTKSVLGQLGKKEEVRFLDTRVHGNLALPSLKGAWPRTVVPYGAYSDDNLYLFDEWWNEQRFVIQFKDVEFSRRELVLAIAQQDGGDHVDPNLDRRLAALRRTESPWVTISGNQGEEGQRIYGFDLASICAVGEEVLYSLSEDKNDWYRRVGLESLCQ